MSEPRTASLIGATGLVGRTLLELLLADERFERVHILVRRSAGVTHPKLSEHVIDFDAPHSWQQFVTGDVLFSALGTTIKAAGSQAAQFKVDHTYQLSAATAARQNGVTGYVLISSAWASPKSSAFYTRMKGQLEQDVGRLEFPRTRILRPGPLDGERKDDRPGERVMLSALRVLSPILPRKLRPNHALTVARAALRACFDDKLGTLWYEPQDIEAIGEGPR